MKEMKRILSLVLCLVMLVGYLPVNARAEGETTTEPSVVLETVAETVTETTEETEPAKPDKPADPKTAEGPKGPGKDEKPAKPEKPGKHEKPGKPEHEKPGKPGEETVPVTEATVPETTEVTVPVTEETVPETTAATVPETTEATVPETTEETVPETTEETLPAMMMMAAPRATAPVHVDAAIFFSDLHTSQSDYKESTVKGIMNALQNSGLNFSSVTSCGDAFSVNSGSGYKGLTGTITGNIRSVFTDIPVNYVWSDHDRYAVEADNTTLLDKTSRLVYGAGNDGVYGTDDDGNYYVYSLSMGDLCSYDRYNAGFNTDNGNNRASKGFTATVQQAVENFQADAAKLKKDRPLFIASHQPLFDNRDDNAFAELWFDAINEVATGMDVAFFYGHNHKYDTGNDYYYAKGSTMPVTTTKGWNGYQTGNGWEYTAGEPTSVNKKLNFTHMCAGYLAPSSTGSTSSTTREGTAVAVTILEDSISYVTYDKNGVYTGSYALNETVKRDHKDIVTEEPDVTDPTVPSQPDTPVVPENPVDGEMTQNGVTVKVPGLSGLNVTTVEKPAVLEGIFGEDAVAYDISVEGFANYSGIASVTVPVPENVEAAKFAVFHVDGDKLVQMPGALSADGKTYTFTTAHFSVFVGGSIVAGAQLSGSYAEKQGAMPATNASTTTTNVTTITSGSYYALYNTKASRDLSDSEVDNRLSFDTNNNSYHAWYITSAGSNGAYYIQHGGPNGKYLTIGTNTAGLSDTPVALKLEYFSYTQWQGMQQSTYHAWDIANSAGTQHLNAYNGKNVYAAGWEDHGEDDDGSRWRLYPMTLGTPGATVTFKLQKPANMILGAGTQNLTYEITMGDTKVDNATINWTSSDTSVVTVNNGVLTANKEGTATITATLTHVNGNELSSNIALTTAVSVSEKEVQAITVPNSFTVYVGANGESRIGTIQVTYAGEKEPVEVPLTLSMLQGEKNTDAVGTYSGLTVTYGGKTVNGITLNVVEKTVNNYPEYPHEGAVKVRKTGTGIDFQSSGIAQVEVSASGVPLKKGADVIVMLDTSSSMTKNNVTAADGTSKTRAKVLEESLANLIAYFKAPGEDGETMDLRVAIADFNGYYGDGSGGTSGTPYDRTSGDYVKNDNSNGSGYNQASKAQVYTGSKALDKDAFIDAADLANTYTLNYTSGTNYDYAFDAIYQLGTAIKTEDRDLYVIFMSDGASLQWNYFGTQNTYTKWNNWLAGTWDADDLTTSNLNSTKHSYFYDLIDHDGDGHINEHRMANAIKGDPNQRYEIIRKSTAGLPDGTLVSVGKEYLYTVPGLGATMFTINFDAKQDGQITVASIDKALASTASDQTGTTKYYYKVTTAAELQHAFDAIGSEIAYAASNARFVDQMGDNYNLQLSTSKYKLTDGTEKTVVPVIEILSYDIYTRDDFERGNCTENQIGVRKGTSRLLEVVKFSEDGEKAYSNIIDADKDGIPGVQVTKDAQGNNLYTISDADDNILAPKETTETDDKKDGVIYAQTFLYNTNPQAVQVVGVNIPTGKDSANLTTGSTTELPSEAFYWKLGTVQSSELAMRYYVYLDGSMEGKRPAGSYPTNNFATLYYDNYVGKSCYKETVSPVLAWKEANVSYAFYLVNDDGKVIVNQTTGQTGTFANKIAVTNPVVYKTVLLNNITDIDASVVANEEGVLPKHYQLYDDGAAYTVTIASNGTGSWEIEKTKTQNTTYVTQYDLNNASAYSNAQSYDTAADYTHTVVWFAVVWNEGAYPDTVVIDYGLPVEISVLKNDMFAGNAVLDSIGAYSQGIENKHNKQDGFAATYTGGTYGTATADSATGKVTYKLNTTNGMQMKTYEQFAYAAKYGDSYYHNSVTVIPATTIYYEDSFIDFTYDEGGVAWQKTGAETNVLQGEDRPGQFSMPDVDANNVYGYDGAYTNCSTYSLDSTAWVHLESRQYARAKFTFFGTGFDVVSVSSDKTGTLIVQVFKGTETTTENRVRNSTVSTYYGQNVDGSVSVNDPAALYQVPVMKIENLEYGQYTAVITASYIGAMDATAESGYDLYLDAIRIYDPAGSQYGTADDADGITGNLIDSTIQNAYIADKEGWPTYMELRNNIIDAAKYNEETKQGNNLTGAIFIDSVDDNFSIADYVSYGPNNEVYLKAGQSVAFSLGLTEAEWSNVADVQIGMKVGNGGSVTYKVYDSEIVSDVENATPKTLTTATDMYYSIKSHAAGTTVITNTAGGIMSITNIKITYKTDPYGAVATMQMTPEDAGMAVLSLRRAPVVEEPEVPETPEVPESSEPEVPESSEPEVPETSEPEVPETSEPEIPETEVTEPEDSEPENTKPDKEAEKIQKEIQKALEKAAKEAEKAAKELEKTAKKVAKTLSKLLSNWF